LFLSFAATSTRSVTLKLIDAFALGTKNVHTPMEGPMLCIRTPIYEGGWHYKAPLSCRPMILKKIRASKVSSLRRVSVAHGIVESIYARILASR